MPTPIIVGWFAGCAWENTDGPNYCVIYIVDTQLANVALDRIIKPGGPRVADPCLKGFRLWYVIIVASEI